MSLHELGFAVMAGPVAAAYLPRLSAAYDFAVENAAAEDLKMGSATTRVNDLVNGSLEFDPIYVFPPLLRAAQQLLGRPFRLSTLLARTLRPHTPAQDLHVDYPADANGWTMLGFILMLDPFTPDNGATRFLPGSHLGTCQPPADLRADVTEQRLACGPAGSLIVFNGSGWHGHTANRTKLPRRSIQGAFIRREASSSFDLPGRLRAETLARIGPLARWVVAAPGTAEERLESPHEFFL